MNSTQKIGALAFFSLILLSLSAMDDTNSRAELARRARAEELVQKKEKRKAVQDAHEQEKEKKRKARQDAKAQRPPSIKQSIANKKQALEALALSNKYHENSRPVVKTENNSWKPTTLAIGGALAVTVGIITVIYRYSMQEKPKATQQ